MDNGKRKIGLKLRFKRGIFSGALIATAFFFLFPYGALGWGDGVTLPSSPVYGQSNPYVYTETALAGGLYINSIEIGSRHWNCGGAQHNVGYITIENASSGQIYATSTTFNQYCGGWDNPDNLAVSFAGELIPGYTLINIKIYYTTWVGDNGYGGFLANTDNVPEIDILYPTEYASTTIAGFYPGWSVINTIASSTNTGLVIWPTLAPTQKQYAEIAETGTVLFPDVFTYTPNYYQGYAYAKLGATVLASSTIRNFSINAPEDITTSTAYASCDTGDSSWFGQAFCRTMVYLFVPDPVVINNFTKLNAKISTVPPFAYFTQIKTALDLNSTTTTPLIPSSTIATFSTVFDPIRSGLRTGLWLLFAFWGIRAIRHVQT